MRIVPRSEWGARSTGRLTPLVLSRVNTIAIHHIAHPNAHIKEVERWHLDRGFNGIGYNYFVDFLGNVYEGRGLSQGAGVANMNSTVVSIGFQGNYQSGINIRLSPPMPDAQFNSGIDIINWVQQRIPNARRIVGHGELTPTACPGDTFPLTEMKVLRKRSAATQPPKPEGEKLMNVNEFINLLNQVPTNVWDGLFAAYLDRRERAIADRPASNWAVEATQEMIEAGLFNGDESGRFRWQSDVTRQELASVLRNFFRRSN